MQSNMLGLLLSPAGKIDRLTFIGAGILQFIILAVFKFAVHSFAYFHLHINEHNFTFYLPALLSYWIIFALLIKRYRDIGVPGIITLLLYFLMTGFTEYMFHMLLNISTVNQTEGKIIIHPNLANISQQSAELTWIWAGSLILFYCIIPLFWPSRK